MPPEPPLTRSQVLAKLRERMVAFAASRNAGPQAEDLAQEVLVVLHEKYPAVEALEELVPLGFQILRFKLAAWRRRTVRRGEGLAVDPETAGLPSLDPDPEAQAARSELAERLRQGLALLGPRCQELFRLKLLGHAFPAIQGLMGAATLNTVYTWDHRCRKNLLEWMGGRWER